MEKVGLEQIIFMYIKSGIKAYNSKTTPFPTRPVKKIDRTEQNNVKVLVLQNLLLVVFTI